MTDEDEDHCLCSILLQIVLKELLENGFLHGDQVTVTGKTMAENLTHVKRLSELGQQVTFTAVNCDA